MSYQHEHQMLENFHKIADELLKVADILAGHELIGYVDYQLCALVHECARSIESVHSAEDPKYAPF